MTLQDDLARQWFQPEIPTGAESDRARPNMGPVTTRFTGELTLDETEIAAPRRPSDPPMTARVEVTQPYIPAIRDTPPEFAKRLNPEASPPTALPAAPAPAPAPRPPAPAPAQQPTAPAPKDTAKPAPPKRRSLVRRVVRRIIGPDLLRKDPPRR